jgi:NAD(P) transhydrogenase subunit alpha
MKLSVLKESVAGEGRVAASPDTVKKLIALGCDVTVQKGAGDAASISDDVFKTAGATIAADFSGAVKDADIIFKVAIPTADEIKQFKAGSVLLSLLNPYQNKKTLEALAAQNVTAFALEMVPRITRAQSMDVLSSQSNLAGYRAVLEAAYEYGRALPMMMTAAGTVAPARICILGAGVAGLQAIATARRMGAIVSAFDVRAAAKEQVESLGAKFIEVKSEENLETAGGYAKEVSDDYKKRQAELLHQTLKTQDIVITTALIPGKPAPVLVTEDMVKDMKAGSVILDMAAASGGNCPLTENDKIVTKHGVKIIGYGNLPSRLAEESSKLFAKNLLNLLTLLVGKESKQLAIDYNDEIVKGCLVTDKGEIVHPGLKETKAV